MNQYKTNDVAKMIGIHVNTVRLYEECGFIPKPMRLQNGYRVFTDLHVEQFRLARAALKVEVLQNGLRKQVVNIIKVSALGEYQAAEQLTLEYIRQINSEIKNAEEAIRITRSLLAGISSEDSETHVTYKRKEAADFLGVTIDTLRNWELNGLFTIKRKENGYRVYTAEDMQRLKVIRSLRCANYSLSAILRMLGALSENPQANIREAIDTPKADDDIINACDKLLTSLSEAKENARYVLGQIEKMKKLSG